MIKLWVFCIMGIISLYGAESNSTAAAESNSSILEAQLQQAIEQEKKFAREQTFYDAKTYDFKGAEVNPKSLEHIELIVPEPDMDSNDFLEMPN